MVTAFTNPADGACAPSPHAGSAGDTSPAAPSAKRVAQAALTGVIVVGPLVALAIELVVLWGHAVHLRDVVLTGALFLVTGH